MRKKSRIIVTGGSGFIGTNLIQFYIEKGIEVINYDIIKPRNPAHIRFWKKLDILDKNNLEKNLIKFKPDYIVHLAAKTDLNGKNIEEYCVNYIGVQNVIKSLKQVPSIKRVIIASSMLVCKIGYRPLHFSDYNPSTFYGESKVLAELVVKKEQNKLFDILIIRPTSIWGPWFGSPYYQFFRAIKYKLFFKFGEQLATKTFGYVGNSVIQINALLYNKIDVNELDVYYIGDCPPLCISDWADLIANKMGLSPPLKLPFKLIKITSIIGDYIGMFGLKFPINSFRFNNMTLDNIVDLSKINAIIDKKLYSTNQGVVNTIKWMESNKGKK